MQPRRTPYPKGSSPTQRRKAARVIQTANIGSQPGTHSVVHPTTHPQRINSAGTSRVSAMGRDDTRWHSPRAHSGTSRPGDETGNTRAGRPDSNREKLALHSDGPYRHGSSSRSARRFSITHTNAGRPPGRGAIHLHRPNRKSPAPSSIHIPLPLSRG